MDDEDDGDDAFVLTLVPSVGFPNFSYFFTFPYDTILSAGAFLVTDSFLRPPCW